MSEGKRATLISFGAQKVSEKKPKERGKTIRISLVLPESNEDTCPEFNYKEELAAAKQKEALKRNNKTEANGISASEYDDDEIEKLVAKLEAKYCCDSRGKKGKKTRKDDYADIGMGYDESDSFIDNTDGYDEMIPEHVSPLHGGFYINCGALEFRAHDEVNSDESSSSDDESTPEKPSSRKHPLESSDESEREKETDHTEEKPAKKLKTSDVPKLKKPHGDKVKRKNLLHEDNKSPSSVATVRELLKQKRTDLQLSPAHEHVGDGLDETNNKKPLSSVTLASINDTIESVVNATVDVANNQEVKSVNDASQKNRVVLLSSEGESSRDSNRTEVMIVELPENLPSDIIEIINNIKQTASTSWEGKIKFFSGPVNKMLLSLEKKCRCLGKQSRMRVYEHLAPFVRCRKESLIRRAKNLLLDSERNRIQTLSRELKNAVERVMPAVLENYETECQKVIMKKLKDNEETKTPRMPYKRFPWSDDLRKMVKEIVVARKRCFLLEGKQRECLEATLNSFLKEHIQPLWPDGWMSMNALNKVCGSVTAPAATTTTTTTDISKKRAKNNTSVPPIKPNNNNNNSTSTLELPQNLTMNPSLSITPLPPPPPPPAPPTSTNVMSTLSNSDDNNKSVDVKLNSVVLPDLQITKTVNGLEQSSCDTNKIDLYEQPPILQPEVIHNRSSSQIDQVIDLTGVTDSSGKRKLPTIKSKHHRYYHPDGENKSMKVMNNEGDDIQKVMEGLKVLQKMSSPIKTENTTSTSSPVSVIAFNKSYSPNKTTASASSNNSLRTSSEYTKADFCSGFQDAFQKQLLGDVNFLKTTNSQPTSSFQTGSGGGGGGVNLLPPSDEYVQNPNNNYSHSQHGQGTYTSIMDDMFSNLLSEYGYGRSALPKSRQSKK